MDHDRYWGGGQFGGPPGAGHVTPDPWIGLLFMGVSLAWLLGPVVIAMAYLWWNKRHAALANQAPVDELVGDDPSAFELLRRRYVVGEIDTPTFETMTERLLLSERAEELHPALAQPARFDRYLRRAPRGQPDHLDQPRQTDHSDRDADEGAEDTPRVVWL